MRFAGRVWRLVIAGADPLAPAAAPTGRFHRDGQRALYASLTAEGAGVAIARYLAEDARPRRLVRLSVTAERVIDLTMPSGLPPAVAALRSGCDPSMVWQDIAAAGGRPCIWDLADAVRDLGAEGMIYASRSRPKLRHLVLFRWGGAGAQVYSDGPAHQWGFDA